MQCQQEDEDIKREAVVAYQYAEWVHAGVMKKAALVHLLRLGRRSIAVCCNSAEFADL